MKTFSLFGLFYSTFFKKTQNFSEKKVHLVVNVLFFNFVGIGYQRKFSQAYKKQENVKNWQPLRYFAHVDDM